MSAFGAGYYQTGNYEHYLSRGARYDRLARELDEFLDRVCLRRRDDPVLDLGCGPGLLVRSLRALGYSRVYGYDPSEWAVTAAGLPEVTTDLNATLERRYGLTLALDSLEHADDPVEILSRLRTDTLIVRVPVTVEHGGRYVLDVSEADQTHKVRLTHMGWRTLLARAGWSHVVSLNLSTLYDSDGVHVAMYRRS